MIHPVVFRLRNYKIHTITWAKGFSEENKQFQKA